MRTHTVDRVENNQLCDVTSLQRKQVWSHVKSHRVYRHKPIEEQGDAQVRGIIKELLSAMTQLSAITAPQHIKRRIERRNPTEGKSKAGGIRKKWYGETGNRWRKTHTETTADRNRRTNEREKQTEREHEKETNKTETSFSAWGGDHLASNCMQSWRTTTLFLMFFFGFTSVTPELFKHVARMDPDSSVEKLILVCQATSLK